MKYYAIWDSDNAQYIATGCNYTDKRSLRSAMYELLKFDFPKSDRPPWIRESLDSYLEIANFELHESDMPFVEERDSSI